MLPRHLLALGALVFGLCAIAAVGAIRSQVELRTLRKQVRAMEALGQQALDRQSLDSLLAHLLSAARPLIVFDRAFFYAADGDRRRLEMRLAWPRQSTVDHAPGVVLGEGLVGKVAERQRGLVGDHFDAGSPDGASPEAARSALLVPLATAGRAVGVAVFTHTQPGFYKPADLSLLQSVAGAVASAMENVRLHQSLRALAVTDGLTGLTNRRRLQEILQEEIWRAQRYNRPVSVILCDVDFFKAFNDTYGHPQGDRLLRGMARVLAEGVRVVDIVARYGGEEFCVVLPETGAGPAERMAERLRGAIRRTPFPGAAGGEPVFKTMSFGVAAFPDDTRDPDRLVALADAALYHAKNNGRDQVQTARRVAFAERTARLQRSPGEEKSS